MANIATLNDQGLLGDSVDVAGLPAWVVHCHHGKQNGRPPAFQKAIALEDYDLLSSVCEASKLISFPLHIRP